MRIAVNLRTYVNGKIGGLENYVRQIVGGIDRVQTAANEPLTIFAHKSEIGNVSAIAPGARVIPVVHETAVKTMEAELETGSYDLLFCPLLVLDPMRPNIPSAVMMPDLQHEFFPEFFEENTLKWRRQTYRPSTSFATHIYTLSQHAKSTIVDRFRTDPDKIEIIYLDVDDEFRLPLPAQPSEAFRKLGLPEEYLFYPANFWPHKNHTNLLKALRVVIEKRPNLGLVLSGDNTGLDRVKQEIADLGLERNVSLVGYVDRAVLVELYQNAKAVTFISRFEGFGIPILESFHAGTPVITSRAGSCEEISGGAALTVDELNPLSIAAGIDRILNDRELRSSLIEAGRKRAAGFSWSRALDLTLKSFERITAPSYSPPSRVQVEEHPVVSIVTPSYNMGRFIRQTIDSVLTQDYPHIDYIVMDAGSKDDTLEILKSYGDRFRYVSSPDKGQADAVNKGFALARGRIFTFLNADDTYLPGAVSAAVRTLVANPAMGVVYGEANYVREDGSNIGRYPTLPFDIETLNRCCFICQPAAFMWSDVFEAAGGLNADLHFALDYDLWMRIAKSYPMLKIDEVLATSRMYRENKTLSKRRPVYLEIMSAAKQHYGYIPFDWVFGYSCYVLDRKDQFFEVSNPSFPKIALSLLLGSYYNSAQVVRYWREWGLNLGFGGNFRGQYSDHWISRKYETRCAIGGRCQNIRITGRHLAPFENGLMLTVRFERHVLERRHLKQRGPFTIDIPCPPELRGKAGPLVLECDRTFRPVWNGDHRRLGCLIDSLTFEDERNVE
jgi:glycosyltransferase involved in cell wall biosynthesis